jgi:hypothetical protein
VIALATLVPSAPRGSTPALCLLCGDAGLVDVLLNVLLFVPLGVGLALIGVRPWRTAGISAALSLVIECLQITIIVGRDASVGDLLMNSIGGVLGYALVDTAELWGRPSRRAARNLAVAWTLVWLVVQLIAGLALAPSMTVTQFYGQINRSITTPFPGDVLAASAGGVVIPNHRLADSRPLRDMLARRATPIEVTVIPHGRTSRPAPIVRIADADGNEILAVLQSKLDVMFVLRTRTGDWRLRPMTFRLARAFPPPDSIGRDTLRLIARYGQTAVTLESRWRERHVQREFRLTPSLGWTMVFPFDIETNGALSKTVLASLWLAALVLPIGYWGWLALDRGATARAHRLTHWAAIVLVPLVLGLVAVPVGLGLQASTPWEWAAALGGVMLGRRWAAKLTTDPTPTGVMTR